MRVVIVFHVGRVSLRPGTQLRRYFMSRHAALVDEVQSALEAGPAMLARRLESEEWRQLDLGDRNLEMDSDATKMMIVLEAIFEQVRARVAPSLPRRLACVFAWPSLEVARRFRDKYVPRGRIHQCRVVQGDPVERDGGLLPPGLCLRDTSSAGLSVAVAEVAARARQYWIRTTPMEYPELLVVGSVEVEALVEPPTV